MIAPLRTWACLALIATCGMLLWRNDHLSAARDAAQDKQAECQLALDVERLTAMAQITALKLQILKLDEIAIRERADAADRAEIMSTCGTIPAQSGEVIDAQSSRNAIDHINRSLD